MSIKDLVSKLKIIKPQYDSIHLELYGLDINMTRVTDQGIPHEVTVVVPRAEVREKYDSNGNVIEREILLNSITVVHAPRHPLAGPPSPPPEIPQRAKTFLLKK